VHVSHHVRVEELGGGGEEEEVTKAGGGESIGRAQRQHHEWLADLQPYALCMASRDHAHARITPQPARKLDTSSLHQHHYRIQSVVCPLPSNVTCQCIGTQSHASALQICGTNIN